MWKNKVTSLKLSNSNMDLWQTYHSEETMKEKLRRLRNYDLTMLFLSLAHMLENIWRKEVPKGKDIRNISSMLTINTHPRLLFQEVINRF